MTTRVTIRDAMRNDLLAMAELPYGGEKVDQLAHALQAGTHAVTAGSRPALVAAALLHDVGRLPHVMAAFPDTPHEDAGAAYVTDLLGSEAGWLVGSHVMAKRALVATDPDYFALLSPASVRSLERQGGPAGGKEVEEFLRHHLAVDAMQLRRWDDQAKDPGVEPLPMEQLLDAALAE
jgi:predicted HD phosphohydrolase